MADGISAEEQRQIDAAIALSLGQADEQPSGARATAHQRSNKPIIIDDSSSDNEEAESVPTAALKKQDTGSSKPINPLAKKDDDDAESVDSSATELSDDDEIQQANKSQSSKKRKASPYSEPDVSESKKPRNENTTSTIADTEKLNIPHRTQNMDPGRYLLGGTSRADMEKERLARVAARQAAQQSDGKASSSVTGTLTSTSASTSQSSKPSASSSSGSRVATLSSLNSASEETSPSLPSTSTQNGSSSSTSKFSSLATLAEKNKNTKYWNGIVRPTSSRFHSGYECFNFADVVGNTDDMQSALLATFCGTPEWIHSHFPNHVKIALMMPCAEHNRFEAMQVASNMRLMNPVRELESRGVMHIKLVILYHKTHLRVAVATANLIDYDWTTIENAVYVQDFPLSKTPTDPASSPFLKTLLRAHRSLGTPTEYYKDALLRFDYSAAKNVRLVLSVPGNFKSPTELQCTGHTGLSHSLQELGCVVPAEGAKLEVEAQGSSIGSYTLDWMRTFYRSCLGWDPKSPNLRTSSSKQVVHYKSSEEWPDVKIVFPTFRTVKESINGPQGGGTIFCPLDYWRKPKFPKQLFYDSRSKRTGLLQHTKMLLGIAHAENANEKGQTGQLRLKTTKASEIDAKEAFKPFGWLYVGSHNFTPAAWGRYSEKTGGLSIANHELGVVVRLTQDDLEAEGSFLATWKRPLQKYGPKDTPWDQHSYKG